MRRRAEELHKCSDGEEVEVWGWVRNRRRHGRLVFIDLRDSTGVVQVAIKGGVADDESLEKASSIKKESAIKVWGYVVHDPRAPGGVEVRCRRLEVVGESLEDYPLRKGVGAKTLYDYRHLYIRSPKVTALLKIRSNLVGAVHEFFRSRGFYEVDCPTIITAAVEGGATLFEVNYFGSKAYLTQSVQFYQEAAIYSLEKVYSVQPSFRAEKSRTTRHLTEFWHVEAELAFADIETLMSTIEELVSYVVTRTAEVSEKELGILGKKIRTEEVEKPFYRIKYEEALGILREHGVNAEWGIDIGADEERIISIQFDRPIFLTHFPREVKAFYHRLDPTDPRVTLSADLLAPRGNGEIVGGGVRIHDYEELMQRIREFQLNPEDYGWYLDLRKFGSVPHVGFGMGIERVLKWILDLPHVRAACLFPRTTTRIYP
jgi:asparaginyl-tRNA synthetase